MLLFFVSGLKRYKLLSLIGDGTYGLVYLATNVETRERVAIKAMKRKYHSWDEVSFFAIIMGTLIIEEKGQHNCAYAYSKLYSQGIVCILRK